MTTAQAELLAELDQLIATETVRERHVRLLQLRAKIETALDNLITAVDGDGA